MESDRKEDMQTELDAYYTIEKDLNDCKCELIQVRIYIDNAIGKVKKSEREIDKKLKELEDTC